MSRSAIPTWFIVLVVVRDGDRWLLVQEAKHDRGSWYLPAGRAEIGETMIEAAERETLEEAGIAIEVDGVIRFEHSPSPAGARVRVLLTARPRGATAPKTTADEHSLQAGWFTLDELARLKMRGEEARELIHHVARGGRVLPLTALTGEGDPL
jgi:ADP-ribose pyrophosphatase YjhB (NUDIX family)